MCTAFLWAFYFLVTVHVNIPCKRWLKVISDGRRNRQFPKLLFYSIKHIKSLMNSSNRTDTQDEKKNPDFFFWGGGSGLGCIIGVGRVMLRVFLCDLKILRLDYYS